MRVYIIGPVPNGHEAFLDAANKLRDLGHEPVYCHLLLEGIDAQDWEWAYFRKMFIQHMYKCDWVVTLPNYELSKGARNEYSIAKELGLKISAISEFVKLKFETEELS